MNFYKLLSKQVYTQDKYRIVPIRYEDRYDILNWRNSQIDILRQQKQISREEQDNYFKTVIDALFDQEKPNQILWSFLYDGKLIGYGGLVHIDWQNKTAEISFLTETCRNQSQQQFISDWIIYLSLIKRVAKNLSFSSIFTYAYDIRPNLYIALEKSGFKETKRMKDFIEINGEMKDVVIHTFDLQQLHWKFAKETDVDLYYKWASDVLVRQNSFNTSEIDYLKHVNWFKSKLNSPECFFYLFYNKENIPIGQVRINQSNNKIVIGISIDESYRGIGFGAEMLNEACDDYLNKFPEREIIAYIKENNTASLNQFTKAGFVKIENVIVSGNNSFKFKKTR